MNDRSISVLVSCLLCRWITVDHHLAHAALGFYDSPFNKSLIFSYDGGGNDGTFNVYFGDRKDGIRHLRWVGDTSITC